MKKYIIALCFIISAFALQAQQDVYLKVNHLLNGNSFALNTSATNNLGNNFSVMRLEYYISQIVLIHDGGQRTLVPNTWILVDASSSVNQMLGNFNVTTLEAVQFAVGVESTVNNLDPAQYPMGHPLALKAPSMHWGWSAGYRFVAMEGKSGSDLSQTFQVHALGNSNYFPFTLATAGTSNGGTLTVEVNAEYSNALKDINMDNGLSVHGETGEAKDLLINFNQNVFTALDGTTTISLDEAPNLQFKLFPNPNNGDFTVRFTESKDVEMSIINLVGQTVFNETYSGNNMRLSTELKTGSYFLRLKDLKSGETSIKKFTVN